MKRSYHLLVPLLLFFFSGCAGEGSPQQDSKENKPNIIIIYADDVGYGDLGAYGAKRIKTPHIDRLARGGIRFTDAYATAAMYTPSRYSLLTGRYAFRLECAGILSVEDPGETQNLAKQNPEKAKELRNLLEEIKQETSKSD